MSVVRALVWDRGTPQSVALFQLLEPLVIPSPELETARRDCIRPLELRPGERRVDLARGVRAADVDPAVLVDLATEEPRRFVPFSWMISARSTNDGSSINSAPPSPEWTFFVCES